MPNPNQPSRQPSDVLKQATGTSAALTPILIYAAQALGHPVPVELIPYVASLVAMVGGWFHPDGRK
jgi:hypothetical protein